MSKKSRAVKAYQLHKARIDRYSPHPGMQWLDQLNDMTKLYLGVDSAQYRALNNAPDFRYSLLYIENKELNRNQFSNDLAIKLIDNYIYYIETNGVYVDPKVSNNMLGTLSNETFFGVLVPTILILCGACFGIGVSQGKLDQPIVRVPAAVSDSSNSSNSKTSSKNADIRSKIDEKEIQERIKSHNSNK